METLLAVTIGVIIAASVYLMLSRNIVRVVIGLALLTNGVNLLIFTAGRLTRGAPPLIPEGHAAPTEAFANALPQALILTAIVIGFGLMAFAVVLAYRAYQEVGTVDVDRMRVAEPPDDAINQPPPVDDDEVAAEGGSAR